MVEVRFDLSRKIFFWIGFFVVLIGVGFVYGYGGTDPTVMGHSGGEIVLDGDTVVDDAFCQKVTGNNCGVGGGGVLDLVNGLHSSSQCTAIGGVIMTDDPDGDYCKLSGECSTWGWIQFKSWRQTSSQTCTRSITQCGGGNGGLVYSCSTGSSWMNGPLDTCTYSEDIGDPFHTCMPATCTATKTHSGCY